MRLVVELGGAGLNVLGSGGVHQSLLELGVLTLHLALSPDLVSDSVDLAGGEL